MARHVTARRPVRPRASRSTVGCAATHGTALRANDTVVGGTPSTAARGGDTWLAFETVGLKGIRRIVW